MLNTVTSEFAKLGYCLFPDVFPADRVTEMRTHLAAATRAQYAELPRHYGEPHAADLFWLGVCTAPKLLDAVESIIGPNLVLVYSSMFIKAARNEQRVAWHQDNTYWPSVEGTEVVTVWLALDDADVENAAMQVIPGSHEGYRAMEMVAAGDNHTLSKKVEVTPELEASAVSLEMTAGSLSIHDSFLVHGSGANHSARRRAGYTIRFCSTDTVRVDTEKHPIPVYLVRGEPGPHGANYVDLRPAAVAE
jgi:ectoine hydroxylase-related dioxygenase (phytanoyl-CoA dioxygenase family)